MKNGKEFWVMVAIVLWVALMVTRGNVALSETERIAPHDQVMVR